MSEVERSSGAPGTGVFVHFRVNRLPWSMIFALALTPALAWAQVVPPKEPGSTAKAADPVAAAEDVARAYRNGTLGERVSIRVTTSAGTSERQSVLLHRAAKEGEASGHRLHLDLSRLELWFDGQECTLTTRTDPTTYFRVAIAPPPTFDAVFREVRPIPLPQVAWGLGDPSTRPLGAMLGDVSWTSVRASGPGATELAGKASSGEVKIVFDSATKRMRSFSAKLPRDIVLELSCSPANAAAWTNWSPSLTGRTRVESLAKLQSTTPTATVGQRLPPIAYITTGYEGWVLPSASDAAPVFVVFVRSGASGEASPALRKKTLAMIDAARAHVPAKAEKGAPPRLVLVGVLAQGNTQPEELAKNATAWIEAMGDSPLSPVWTTAEWSLIAGGHVDADVLLHVVGAERKLVATISCDGECEAGEVGRRVREVISPTRDVGDPARK